MSDQQPVIKCDSVYKIFGKNAEKMLQDANGKVVAAEFQKAGCVVGVNNASFEVNKGEMLGGYGSFRLGQVDLASLYFKTNRCHCREYLY